MKRSIGTKFWPRQVFVRKLKDHWNQKAGQPNTYAWEKTGRAPLEFTYEWRQILTVRSASLLRRKCQRSTLYPQSDILISTAVRLSSTFTFASPAARPLCAQKLVPRGFA